MNEMNFENIIYKDLKKYLEDNSKFSPKVLPSSAKTLSSFPTVVFHEIDNALSNEGTTLDRTQVVYDIVSSVEIYTQNQLVGTTNYASKYVNDELKYLVFEFFDAYGATRTSCQMAEYYNKEVDRLVITYSYSVNNWNRKIN